MTVRVRYAPSPTGHLHIGGVRTALFNYLFARHHQGDFILRVEDTDLERNVPGAEAEMLDGFRWLGFEWAEGPDVGGPYGPYRCTERLEIYQKHLQLLANQSAVYPCYCTPEELESARTQPLSQGHTGGYRDKCRYLSAMEQQELVARGRVPSWRFAIPLGQTVSFHDKVRGDVTFATDELSDFVVMKSNGIPTYQFQVVVDDALMKITHVIRGEEHLSNTPWQILLYDALGFSLPEFAHLPQVLNTDRKKLSKRDASVQPLEAYRDKGYLPGAIVNFLALLGWSPGGEEEIFTLPELSERFDLEHVSRSGAVFDTQKLDWMGSAYLRQLDILALTEMVRTQLARNEVAMPDHADRDWLQTLVTLYQEQMSCAADFMTLAHGFLHKDIVWDDEARNVLADDMAIRVVTRHLELCQAAESWTPEDSRARCKQVQTELGVKGKQLFMPIRAAVTGTVHGRDLHQSIACLSQDWVIQRSLQAIAEASPSVD